MLSPATLFAEAKDTLRPDEGAWDAFRRTVDAHRSEVWAGCFFECLFHFANVGDVLAASGYDSKTCDSATKLEAAVILALESQFEEVN